jgi:hypothetical protein
MFIVLACPCICGYQFTFNDYKIIYEFLKNKNYKEEKKMIEFAVTQNFKKMCMECKYDYYNGDLEFYLLTLKDQEITMTYKIKEFKHVLCENCYIKQKISKYI